MAEGFAGGLRVTAPEPTLHLAALARLIAGTFWGELDEPTLATVGDALKPGGNYSWRHSRVGLTDDGTIATHTGLVDFDLRVGAHARLRTAGLCAIVTVEEHRRRGYMGQTMRDLLTNLAPAGFDISILFGIDDFYRQFDYLRAWPEHRFELHLADLPQVAPVVLEGFEHEQPSEVSALANQHNCGRTGTVVREGGWFTKLVEDRGHLWRDARGQVAGYVLTRINDEQLLVTDHAGDVDQVLGVIRQLMQSSERVQVRLGSIAPDGPLARRLRHMNAREIIQHQRNGGALIRMVNLRQTITRLLPDLTGRLRESVWADWCGVICLDNDDELVGLKIQAGEIVVVDDHEQAGCEITGPGLAQLVIGTDTPELLMEEGNLSIIGEAGLVGALFPALQPGMPEPDHF